MASNQNGEGVGRGLEGKLNYLLGLSAERMIASQPKLHCSVNDLLYVTSLSLKLCLWQRVSEIKASRD